MTLSAATGTHPGRGPAVLAAAVGAARALMVGVLAAYSGLLLFAVAPVALGLRSSVVLTGSMRPAIQPGDVVLSSRVPASLLRPGQVLLVDNPAHPGAYLMHRYQRTAANGAIITRGDANRSEDSTPVPVRNVRGVPRIRVPFVGMPIVWLRLGAPPAVKYAAGALAAVLLVACLPRRRRRTPARPVPPGASWRPRVRRVRRAEAAVALAVSAAMAAQFSSPSAQAAFTGAAANPTSYQAVSSFYSSVVADDGPVGYWRGGSLTDVIGGATASVVGTVYPRPGATPDGDPAVYFPAPGALRVPKPMGSDFTVEFWFATTTGAGGIGSYDAGAPLMHSSVEGGAGNIGISISADGHLLAGMGSPAASNEVTVVSGTGGYADGGWHQVALARDASTGALLLYVDGSLSASGAGGTQLLDSVPYFYFGVSPDLNRYGGDWFDEISSYAAVLTPAQIATHYAARAAAYAAAVAADSPAGYWKLDDLAGTTIVATTGGAGAYLGEVARGVAPAVSGGTAVRLDQVGGYASVPRLVSGDFSLEFWFRSSGGANSGQWWETAGLVDGDAPFVADDFGVGLSETGRVVAGVGNPDTSIESAPGFNDGGWHHVVFARTSATGGIALYVDGAQVAANPGTGNTGLLDAATSLTIGRGSPTSPGNSTPSDATVDELAQYPLVLTPGQVQAHYLRATSP